MSFARSQVKSTNYNSDTQLTDIKAIFNWEEYMYLNPNLTDGIKCDTEAWYHFRKFGFKQGLKWKLNDNTITDTNNENYTVLVVMPTYNRPNKIEGVIQMIINQTFTNWFFLIIDDGSIPTNKSTFRQIKERYKQHEKILFLENDTNCHIAKTLNRGIDYLLDNNFTHFTWISDDNEYYNDFLNTLLINNTYFNYSSFHSQSLTKNIHSVVRKYCDYKDVLNKWGGCASFMWTKSAIQQIGYYDEQYPCCEDFDFLIRTFKINSQECHFIDKPLMKFIYHDESLSITLNKPELNILLNKINCKYIE